MPTYRHTHVDGIDVIHKRDPRKSISSHLGLTQHGGKLAAVIESPKAKEQISALLDLLDLHLNGRDSPDGIALLLDAPAPEAVAALEALCGAIADKIPVELLQPKNNSWVPILPSGFDATDAQAHYKHWTGYLQADFTVPALVYDLIAAVGLRELRAYPQLTAKGEWSIRLEGLEVARIKGLAGRLGVGKPGKLGDVGPERQAWLDTVHTTTAVPISAGSLDRAADLIRTFASRWAAIAGGRQNEHVLESRILRGSVPVKVAVGTLELIKPDVAVNWGSQFPTIWGPKGRARYLDALLRDPIDSRIPWAIEMKVNRSEGQYYRHAVVQAVLYRHFIRRATPLHFWFDQFGLDPTLCRAAVVVPTVRTQMWQDRLSALCALFGVDLVVVDEAAATR
ncbi:hypothetical protein [Nocardioides sp. HB32]